ncbi:MAG: D-tyrosyl-tRNA(Tyr) deacylase [Anaerolineae bacterium]|nr:D-tyrosyl-tRNA(Tyr) deacylase [Anaerolineae bacterium]
MRALLQRVSRGSVTVDGQEAARIGPGLVILVGVAAGDTPEQAAWLADKAANLRIFEDDEGKMNLSVLDRGGEAVVVSQFTLYADTRHGRRPGFSQAALPQEAEPLVAHFAECLAAAGVRTQTGVFQAHMLVEILNDGPVTILLER